MGFGNQVAKTVIDKVTPYVTCVLYCIPFTIYNT